MKDSDFFKKKVKNKLRIWMDECFSRKAWDYDLHIDEIDKNIKKGKKHWLESAIEIFKIAENELRREDFIIVLGIYLKPLILTLDVNLSKTELQNELSWTPPSLWIVEKNSNALIEIKSNSTHLTNPIFGLENTYSILFNENQNDGESDRGIYIFRTK